MTEEYAVYSHFFIETELVSIHIHLAIFAESLLILNILRDQAARYGQIGS